MLTSDGISQCRNELLKSHLFDANIDTIIISSLERSMMTMKYLYADEIADGTF